MVESKNTKHIEDYVILLDKFLGKGAYGEVYEGYHIDRPNERLAIKNIQLLSSSSPSAREKLEDIITKELLALENLKAHENMINFIDKITTEHNLYIITELCEGGDLSKLIEKKTISKSKALFFFKQIVEAMCFANSKNYFHRDLKPENILLKENNIKIADLGFAKCKNDPAVKSDQTYCGTTLYMAPEVSESEKYSWKCDVWSLGVLMFQMLTGKTPWTGKNAAELLKNIKNKELEFPEDCEIEKDLKNLLRKMLEKNQDARIDFKEVMEHEAMKKIRRRNLVEEYFSYLMKMAEFLISLGKAIRKKRSKLGFEKEFTLKIQGILMKVALNNHYKIVAILDKKEKPNEQYIRSQDFNKENIKKLTVDYHEAFNEYLEKFNAFIEENSDNFEKDFKEIVLIEDPSIHKEFKRIYRKTFEIAMDSFQKNKEEFLNKETEEQILQLILKMIKVRTYDKLFEEFLFEIGEDNEKIFEEFKESLEEMSQKDLIKTLTKLLKKIKE